MNFFGKLILILFFFTSCENNSSNTYEYYYPNGKLKKRIIFDKPYKYLNIKVINYFESGKISEIYKFQKGKLTGNYYLFHNTGQLKNLIQFKDGIQHGIDRTYNKNGKLVTEYFFIDGKRLIWKNLAFYTDIKKWGYGIYYFTKKNIGYLVGKLILDKKWNILENASHYYKVTANNDTIEKGDTCNITIKILMSNAKNSYGYMYIGNLNKYGSFEDSLSVKKIPFSGKSFSFTYIPKNTGDNYIFGKIFIHQDTLIHGEKYSKKAEFILYYDIFTPLSVE